VGDDPHRDAAADPENGKAEGDTHEGIEDPRIACQLYGTRRSLFYGDR
jgi:hypothetical protein